MLVRRCSCKNPGYVTIKKENTGKLSFSDIIDGQDIRVAATKNGIEVTCTYCNKNLNK